MRSPSETSGFSPADIRSVVTPKVCALRSISSMSSGFSTLNPNLTRPTPPSSSTTEWWSHSSQPL